MMLFSLELGAIMEYVVVSLIFLLVLESLHLRRLADKVGALETSLYHIERKIDQIQEGLDCIPKQRDFD